jgi:PKD repeat protein
VTGTGDQVIEFAPGDGEPCPQPTGRFAVSNETNPGVGPNLDTGTGTITVTAGTKLEFDASGINPRSGLALPGGIDLHGGVPWAYDWDLAGGSGIVASSFTANTSSSYTRATPVVSYTYTTPGTYTATLDLVNDFGTLRVTREIDVTTSGPTTAAFTGPATAVAGQPVSFDAAGSSSPAGEPFVDYHWNFGNGASDDTSGPAETWIFENPGTFTVTLTVINALGVGTTATQQIAVAPAPIPSVPAPAPAPPTTTTGTSPTAHTADRSPTTLSPRLAAVKRATALKVTLSCPSTKVSCGGTLQVRTASAVPLSAHRGAKRRTLTLASAKFSIASGASKTLTVHLASTLAPALAFLQLVKLQVTIAAHDSYGDAKTQRLTYYLTAPPSRARPRRFG